MGDRVIAPEDLQLLNIDQVAKLLGIRRDFCAELALRGTIPSIKVGRYRQVPAKALAGWMKQNTQVGSLA